MNKVLHIIEITMMPLVLYGPTAVEGIKQSRLRSRNGIAQDGGTRGEISTQCLHIGIERARLAGLVNQRAVILFLPTVGGAPLPVEPGICSMTNSMPSQGARLTGFQAIVDACPV